MTTEQTRASIITAFVNGTLSHSASKSALRAIGVKDPEAVLKAAWEPKPAAKDIRSDIQDALRKRFPGMNIEVI